MEKIIKYKKGEVHFTTTGTGPAVMLVHGFGEDGAIWYNLANVLKENFTVIIPDLPGSGKSKIIGKGDANDHLSIDDYADVLNEIRNQEKISEFILIGHSMGGYITLAFAEKFPEKLKAFGLFHSSAFADNEDKKNTRLKAIDFINKNGAAAFLKTSTPNLFAPEFQEQHPKVVEETISRFSYFSNEALISYYYAMIERPERIHVLQDYVKPVLFIIAEKDQAIPFEASLKQCHLPQQSEVIILPTGHMGMIEKEVETTEAVVNFLIRVTESDSKDE